MRSRTLRRSHLNPNTPISCEREFSLFHPDCAPTNRCMTNKFIGSLQSKLAGRSRTYEVVEEVAGNSFEIKVCFSNAQSIERDLRLAYSHIERTVREMGLLVIGTSSPVHSGEFNDFFTTIAFPFTKRMLGRTNSIHLHIGGKNEDELLRRYNAGNRLAPILLDVSQSSVIDGEDRGRARQISAFLGSVPHALSSPFCIEGFDAFFEALERGRSVVEAAVRGAGNDVTNAICARYPELARTNGHGFELLRLTPDKMFSLARLRPDKRSEVLGLEGSVEIRALDGQATLDRDLALIEFTLGALAYNEARDGVRLCDREISDITGMIDAAARAAVSAGSARMHGIELALAQASEGLRELGIPTGILELVREMILHPSYLAYSGMGSSEIIKTTSHEFMHAARE